MTQEFSSPSNQFAGNTGTPLAVGIVLSGGGSRAAYQAGVLKALAEANPLLKDGIRVIVGSSIGAVNGIVLGAGLNHSFTEAASVLVDIWRERTYRNSFAGSASHAFLRAMRVAFVQYLSPGPEARSLSVFNPTPLINRINQAVTSLGGLDVSNMAGQLSTVAVMTTVEGQRRKSLLIAASRQTLSDQELLGSNFDVTYVRSLSAAHGFASAALPSVLPPVKLSFETGDVTLVDGGIADNIPVDPAVRFGADQIIIIDVSGRRWWFDHYGQPHDTIEPWELPAKANSYCLRPPDIMECRSLVGFGALLKQAIGTSTKEYIVALGPTWPIFKLLKLKMGDELAYEVMTYAVLHPQFSEALIALGYEETKQLLAKGKGIPALASPVPTSKAS